MPRKNKRPNRSSKQRFSSNPQHTKTATYKGVFKTGKLSLLKNGRAFVEHSPLEQDIEIDVEDIGNAMHGDVVRVELIKKLKSGRVKGKVDSVIERGQKLYIGVVEKRNGKAVFHAQTSYILPLFSIDLSKSINFDNGDNVVAEFLQWNEEKHPLVRVVELCKHWSSTKLVYHQILYDQKFLVGFSPVAIQESSAMQITDHEKKAKYRKDFTDIFTFTIDPTDAKDFDDAISFERIGEQLFQIGVHIADVTHFLKSKSLLDKEAYQRATSVYMPGYVEPMLPEHLSNNLCSLVPHEDRLCFAIIFQITAGGEIKSYEITKTTINSNRRFAYDEVQQILDAKNGEYFEVLQSINTIAQTWRTMRMQRGSIDFQPSERKIILKPNQEVSEIVIESSNESHQLVEEFMLKANEYVAQHLATKAPSIPFPSRVHDQPNEEKLFAFANFAKSRGYKVDVDPDKLPQSLNAMIKKESAQNPYSPLSSLAIRCMAKAQYAIDAIGHYGLGFKYYAHFTSPIRRYPDVILHRILFAVLQNEKMDTPQLQSQCNHCNERERASMEVEREAKKYKTVEFMQAFVGSTFDAIVTGVSERGIWAETHPYFAEGFITIDEMNKREPFKCFPEAYCMKGMRSGKKIEVGDKVAVKILSASILTKKIDFQWITKTT